MAAYNAFFGVAMAIVDVGTFKRRHGRSSATVVQVRTLQGDCEITSSRVNTPP